MSKAKDDHVVVRFDGVPNLVMECKHCGGMHTIYTPCDTRIAVAQMKEFGRIHENCKPTIRGSVR